MSSIAHLPRKMTAVVLAVASIGVAALGPDDAQAKKVTRPATSLSIEPSAPGFSGELASGRESCESNRKVVLYKQKSSKRNRRKDGKVGSDIARPNGDAGMWHVDSGPAGRYYAYVAATERCKAAVSRSIRPSVD